MTLNFLAEIMAHEKILPNKTALVIDGKSYSYHNLLSQAEKLSNALKSRIKKNIPCIILSEKTHFFYQSVLSCFLANLIYTPINIEGSLERNKKIIQVIDEGIILVGDIGHDKLLPLISAFLNKEIYVYNKPTFDFLEGFYPKNKIKFLNINNQLIFKKKYCDNTKIAYLLFTSGSTGSPKGVPISYKNLNAYLSSVFALFPCNRKDQFSQISDIGFDISIHEMLLCWLAGGALHVYNPNYFSNIITFIKKSNITHLILIPSMIDQIVKLNRYFKSHFLCLKMTIVCGEAFPITYAKLWQKIAPRSTIINFYGPTEATVSCIYHVYNEKNNYGALTTVPIGYPFPGVGVELTEYGEIVVLGEQVAKEYLFTEAAQDKKFKWCIDKKVNYYFTGDRGFFHPKYGFVFKGRMDDQWQVMGYRVEKLEIENVLKLVTGFQDICVVPHVNAEKLIDYLCLFSIQPFNLKNYRKKLESYLMSFLMPKQHFFIESFPRLTNGKINFRELTSYINISKEV